MLRERQRAAVRAQAVEQARRCRLGHAHPALVGFPCTVPVAVPLVLPEMFRSTWPLASRDDSRTRPRNVPMNALVGRVTDDADAAGGAAAAVEGPRSD